MQVLRRAIGILGLGVTQESGNVSEYQVFMQAALKRIHLAELQLRESSTPEELDVARRAILSGWAEVQQLVRSAKRERGITVRPIAETEETYKAMLKRMGYNVEDHQKTSRRKTGTGR